MATRLVDSFIRMQQKRLSRRGFLAKLGGVTAGLALTMVGAGPVAKRVQAAPCCPTPYCVGCPGVPGCPGGCTVAGVPTICCDQGSVGSTNTIHQCQLCTGCGGGSCYCEFDTGTPCPLDRWEGSQANATRLRTPSIAAVESHRGVVTPR